VIAVPCKTRESEETIRLIMHHWILRLGYPREILADNDSSFTSEVFNAVLAYFNIKPNHGTAYKCSSTSKVERANKRINTALRLTLTEGQLKDWDLYLSYVCFALNCLRSRHTGVSPNLLVYGRQLNTPLDLTIDGNPVVYERKSKQHGKAYTLYRTVRNIVQKARKHAALDFQYADNTYNRNLRGPYFNEDDWCFTLINCPKHKFAERWKGPYRICKKISDHLYVLELENGRDKVFNISKLKRYVKSKFSPQLNPEAQQFTPNETPTAQPGNTSAEDTENPPGLIEVEFEPMNSRLDSADTLGGASPEADIATDNQPHHTDVAHSDWELVEHEDTQQPVVGDQEESRVTHPPEADPIEPQGNRSRYPQRSRTATNPLQMLWKGKSYN
jgi:hypothetical protein